MQQRQRKPRARKQKSEEYRGTTPQIAPRLSKDDPEWVNQEGWDDPLVFTHFVDVPYMKRCRDKDTGNYSILPNEQYRQNKYAVFYMPKGCKDSEAKYKNPWENPVVGFYPLQEAHGKDKKGAGLSDLLGFVRHLYASRNKKTAVGRMTCELESACRIANEMEQHMSIIQAYKDLVSSGKKLARSAILAPYDDGEHALFLKMQWGKFAQTNDYNGYLYGPLVAFVNEIVSRLLEDLMGPDKKRSDDSRRLHAIGKILDVAVGIIGTRRLPPPLHHLSDDDPYDPRVHLYPLDVLNYLVKHGALTNEAPKNLRMWWYHIRSDGSRNTRFAYADLLEDGVTHIYEDEARTLSLGHVKIQSRVVLVSLTKGFYTTGYDAERWYRVIVTIPVEGKKEPLLVPLYSQSLKGEYVGYTTGKYEGIEIKYPDMQNPDFPIRSIALRDDLPERVSRLLWDKAYTGDPVCNYVLTKRSDGSFAPIGPCPERGESQDYEIEIDGKPATVRIVDTYETLYYTKDGSFGSDRHYGFSQVHVVNHAGTEACRLMEIYHKVRGLHRGAEIVLTTPWDLATEKEQAAAGYCHEPIPLEEGMPIQLKKGTPNRK